MSTLGTLHTLQQPTTSARVARHLLDLIGREGMKPGAIAPSEGEICRDLGVSRGSVREAYRTLAALGILEVESGKRPRLQSVNGQVLAQVVGYALSTAQVDSSHVLLTRRALEVQAVQQAARCATAEQKRRMRDLIDAMRVSVLDKDHARRVSADMALHGVIAEASCNPLNPLLLTALRAPLEQLMHVDLGERRSEEELASIVDAHAVIVDRIVAGDAPGAGAAMSAHFDMSYAAQDCEADATPNQVGGS